MSVECKRSKGFADTLKSFLLSVLQQTGAFSKGEFVLGGVCPGGTCPRGGLFPGALVRGAFILH